MSTAHQYKPPQQPNRRGSQRRILALIAVLVSLFTFAAFTLNQTVVMIIGFVVATILALLALAGEEERAAFTFRRLSAQEREKQQREQILYNVYQAWIESVLRKNTEGGLLDIKHQLVPDAVLKKANLSEYVLPQGSVGQIFHDIGGKLLILGAPGSGKTILLLQLAEYLLRQAQANPREPMPLVFNLSSWAAKQDKLGDWLVDEMQRAYGIRRQNGTERLARNQFVLLLDGLDEVAEVQRDKCVEAINIYRFAYPNQEFVVCSRIADYALLQGKLDLNSAVLLNELTEVQIKAYLSDDASVGIRELIAYESHAKAMAQTPFLLNTMKLAYSGIPYTGTPFSRLKLDNPTFEARRDHILAAYTDQHASTQIRHYLKWLSYQMVQANEIAFYIEDLQPDWLGIPLWRYRLVAGLVIVLGTALVTLLVVLLSALLVFGLVTGLGVELLVILAFGLSLGLNAKLLTVPIGWLMRKPDNITMVEFVRWSLRLKNMVVGLVVGLGMGVIYGLVVGLLGWIGGWVDGLFFGLLLGLFFGLIGGLEASLETSTNIKGRRIANQGFYDTLRNAIWIGLVFGLAFGSVLGLIVGIGSGSVLGLVLGLGLGMGFGMGGGSQNLVQHIILRHLLYREGVAPLNYAKFLTECVELGLMRQVGGGFIFRHRYLQEYFADQYKAANPPTAESPL